MPQGKFKKVSPKGVLIKKKSKGVAFTRRSNAPVLPNKSKLMETQKLSQAVTKTLNKNLEAELRAKSKSIQTDLSKAQLAVAKHHIDKVKAGISKNLKSKKKSS